MKGLSKVQITRRERLQLLIAGCGSKAALAKKLGFSKQSRISHLTGAKGMGERAARDMERRLGLAPGWMDGTLEGGGIKADGNDVKRETPMSTFLEDIDKLRNSGLDLAARVTVLEEALADAARPEVSPHWVPRSWHDAMMRNASLAPQR
jgi:hypothetical protein